MKHVHKWIKTLLEGLDAHVDDRVKTEILENCGRSCIPRKYIQKAKAAKKNTASIDEFADKLSKDWKHLQRRGDDLYVVYEKCYCPIMKDFPDTLSATFCNCSRGWIKELFESTLGKTVDVKLEKSIKQGDDVCRFKVVM